MSLYKGHGNLYRVSRNFVILSINISSFYPLSVCYVFYGSASLCWASYFVFEYFPYGYSRLCGSPQPPQSLWHVLTTLTHYGLRTSYPPVHNHLEPVTEGLRNGTVFTELDNRYKLMSRNRLILNNRSTCMNPSRMKSLHRYSNRGRWQEEGDTHLEKGEHQLHMPVYTSFWLMKVS